MDDIKYIELKIDSHKKIYLNKKQILFEERATWIPFVLFSILLSSSINIFIFLKLLFPWFQIFIILITYSLSMTYKKIMIININGKFEKKIFFWGFVWFSKHLNLNKSIFCIEIFDMGDVNGMPNGKLGYSVNIMVEGSKKKIFRLYDRKILLSIIRFLKENNYILRGWDWDY